MIGHLAHLFALLGVLATLLIGCQSDSDSSQERHKAQILSLNVYTEPPTLDPGQAGDSASDLILAMLYDGLFVASEDGSVKPAVAESYELSEDKRTYTFHLRKTLWSDGTPVTSHDFAFAWRRVLDPRFSAEQTFFLLYIEGAQDAKTGKIPLDAVGIRTPDDLTLVVTLTRPVPFFLELLVGSAYMPVKRAIVEHNPDWALEAGKDYVSNGPFILNQWVHQKEISLVRNANGWDAQAVKLNAIHLLLVQDTNTELALFEKGIVDMAGRPVSMDLPMDSLPMLREQGRLKVTPGAATYYYAFNTEKPPFTNAKLRKAFAYAVNRKEIVDNVTKGGEQAATCLTAPPLNLEMEPCFVDGDVTTARRLFQEALQEMQITKQQLPPINLSYNTSESHHKIAQAVQQQWHDAFGIQVNLENVEWKVYLDKMASGDFTIGRMTYSAFFNDPFTFLDRFMAADSSYNHSRWLNPQVLKVLDDSLNESAPPKRYELLKQAQRLLINQMPIIPIYFLTYSYLCHPDLKGFFISPTGWIYFRYAYFSTP